MRSLASDMVRLDERQCLVLGGVLILQSAGKQVFLGVRSRMSTGQCKQILFFNG